MRGFPGTSLNVFVEIILFETQDRIDLLHLEGNTYWRVIVVVFQMRTKHIEKRCTGFFSYVHRTTVTYACDNVDETIVRMTVRNAVVLTARGACAYALEGKNPRLCCGIV